MAGRPLGIQNNQAVVNYINKKGINELFEVGFSDQFKKTETRILFFSGYYDRSNGE